MADQRLGLQHTRKFATALTRVRSRALGAGKLGLLQPVDCRHEPPPPPSQTASDILSSRTCSRLQVTAMVPTGHYRPSPILPSWHPGVLDHPEKTVIAVAPSLERLDAAGDAARRPAVVPSHSRLRRRQ